MLNKKWVLSASLAAATLLSCTGAFAEEDKKAPGSGPSPYTDCGIGAALFSDTKWAAVTSNVIWDLGSTAITSATASPQTCSAKKVAAAMFINHTYDTLAEETASGHGEHLTTVLNIFGCDSAHQANATHQIRGAMGQAVSTPGYVEESHLEKASNLYLIIENSVNASCQG